MDRLAVGDEVVDHTCTEEGIRLEAQAWRPVPGVQDFEASLVGIWDRMSSEVEGEDHNIDDEAQSLIHTTFRCHENQRNTSQLQQGEAALCLVAMKKMKELLDEKGKADTPTVEARCS